MKCSVHQAAYKNVEKHTSVNHTVAAWCQHPWNKQCKTVPCQCITYFIEHYTKNSNSGSGQDK